MDPIDRPGFPLATGGDPGMGPSDPSSGLFEAIERALPEIESANDYFRARYAIMTDPVRGPHARALMRYEIALSGVPIAGAEVLDAGSGTGTYAVALAAMGARRVVGVDRFADHVTALRGVARRFGLPIEAREGDVARMAEPAASFDLVYCREAISHFADWVGFVGECARLLRPGGAVVVSDGNNGANVLVRQRIHRMWLRSELGPFDLETFPPGRPLPYLFRRWMLIRRELPGLPDEQVFRLGIGTATLGGRDLQEAVHQYTQSGRLPVLRYRAGMSVRRPEDGQRTEEPVDPLDLARRWSALGLDARVHPHFGFGRGAVPRTLNAIAGRIPVLAARISPAYVVTARRPIRRLPAIPTAV